jgi:hypothetical protein
MPWVWLVLASVNFLLIPLLSVIHTWIGLDNVYLSQFTGQLILIALINAILLVYWVPKVIKKILIEKEKVVEENNTNKLREKKKNWYDLDENDKTEKQEKILKRLKKKQSPSSKVLASKKINV